jgi:dipeptidyl aminopeptidase/acylaminoacyl peptidase
MLEILLPLLLGLAPAPPAIDPVRPTLEQIFDPPRLLGTRPDSPSLSADGRFVLFRRAEQDREEARSEWWVVAASGGEPRRIYEAKDEARCFFAQRGAELLAVRDGWLERVDLACDAPPQPLFELGAQASTPILFEDSPRLALVAGDDAQLFVLDLETLERRAPAASLRDRSRFFQVLADEQRIAVFAAREEVAKDAGKDAAGEPGKPAESAKKPEGKDSPDAKDAKNGKDAKKVLWIVTIDGSVPPRATTFEEDAQTEIAPSGRFALRTTVDRKSPRQLLMADYLTPQVSTLNVRSSLPGDPGMAIDFELFDLDSGKRVALPLDAGKRFWTFDASFARGSDTLLLDRISDDFEVRQLLALDPVKTSARLAHAERDEAWLGGPERFSAFAEDGKAVFTTSEESGYNKLYRVPLDGGERVCLTPFAAEGEVLGVRRIGRSDRFLVTHNDGDPAAHVLEWVDGASGERRRLSAPDGVADSPAASRDGSQAVFRQAFLGVPAEIHTVALAAGEGGAAPGALRLTHTQPPEYEALSLVPPRVIDYTNPRDGQRVRAFLYLPPQFEEGKRHPLIVFAHGAGYLQQVLRSMTAYEPNYLFHQRLARKGYVVLDPDYRHSAGYGRKFRTDVHGHLGGKDLDDIVAGVQHLEREGLIDPKRVGIYGGSYGGFLTLMALFTQPETFTAGAALRSVTDWRTYNSWYVNPRLGDPVKDAANYVRSSPIDHAERLAGPLLLLHGLKDSNVFAQDTIRLVEKLVELRKDFELMLYPSQDHGFRDPDAWFDQYRRIERFFDRHLTAPGAN